MRNAVTRYLTLGLMAAVGGWAVPVSAQQSVADFYKNKQIEFLTGGAAGNVYDVWVRVIGRYMGKYIPGNPTFITRNMLGGGHLVATNHLYNQSPRDGTVIAMVSRNMPFQDLLQVPAAKFKTVEMPWIGSPEISRRVCVAKADAKVKKAEDLFTTELVVGGTGAGSAVSNTPVLLNKLLGMKLKVVEGYQTGPEIFLAMERGELDGVCQTLAAVNSTRPGWLEQGKIRILFNMEKNPLPGVNAPSIYSFTKTDLDRAVIAFYNSSAELGRPVNTTPGVPADRLAALRKAFDETMKDKEFIAETKKLDVDLDPMTAAEVQAVSDVIFGTPKPVIDKLIELVGKLGE